MRDAAAPPPRVRTQLVRFGIVGVAVNAALYLAFVALVALGAHHHAAMTLTYATGIALSFALHRRWTFGSRAPLRAAAPRHALAYLAGYLINLAGLALLVDLLHAPHALAQALLVIVVAAFLFAAQKHWVFAAERARA